MRFWSFEVRGSISGLAVWDFSLQNHSSELSGRVQYFLLILGADTFVSLLEQEHTAQWTVGLGQGIVSAGHSPAVGGAFAGPHRSAGTEHAPSAPTPKRAGEPRLPGGRNPNQQAEPAAPELQRSVGL